jgi:hypothetical protein
LRRRIRKAGLGGNFDALPGDIEQSDFGERLGACRKAASIAFPAQSKSGERPSAGDHHSARRFILDGYGEKHAITLSRGMSRNIA